MSPISRRRLLITGLLVLGVPALIGILIPAGAGWDFANFYDTGRRAAAGELGEIYRPGSLIAGAAPQGGMAFWGAPLSAWLYAPLALFSAPVALVLFKLAGTIAFAVGLFCLYRQTAEAAGLDAVDARQSFALVILLLVALYQPFWTIYRVGGQTTPFVFLLVVAASRAYRRRLWPGAALALLLVVLIKPGFVFIPALLFFLGGRRFALWLAGIFLAAAAGSILLLGWPIHRQFLDILIAGSRKPSPWFFNSSLAILGDAFRPIRDSGPVFGEGGPLPGLIGLGLRGLGAATIVWLAWRAHRLLPETRARRGLDMFLAVALSLLAVQVVWEHYLSLLFIPLLFLVAQWRSWSRGARLLLVCLFALMPAQNLILVMAFRSHVPLTSHAALLAVSLVKAGPLLLFLLWLLRYQGELLARWHRLAQAPEEVGLSGPAGALALEGS